MVATLSEFAIPSIGIATAASAASMTLRRDAAALSTKDQGRRKHRRQLVGANAGGGLFGNHDPSASGFRVGDSFARVLALAPGHPVLSALRRLHESAFVQFDFRAADHQLLHEKGVAKPEDGADVVVLRHAIENDRNRPPWPGNKLVAGGFGAAQLRRCQRPAHFRAISR